MKWWMWLLAAIVVYIFAYLTFASNHRIVAVIPYCFDGQFGEMGVFTPCSELTRYYDA